MLMIQLTGLSGSGKTTIANRVKYDLELLDILVKIIDGDYYRQTVCKDLGFSKEDRFENIRRLGKIASELIEEKVCILAIINPYEEIRRELKAKYGAKTVYISCELNTVIERDTKGLYRRALLPDDAPEKLLLFSGVNDTYEAPTGAELTLNTDVENIKQSSEKLLNFILRHLNQ